MTHLPSLKGQIQRKDKILTSDEENGLSIFKLSSINKHNYSLKKRETVHSLGKIKFFIRQNRVFCLIEFHVLFIVIEFLFIPSILWVY